MKSQITDQRKHKRIEQLFSIQFRILKTKCFIKSNGPHLALTRDLSLSGAAFQCDTSINEGDIIQIDILISGRLYVYDGKAEVVRVTPKQNGELYNIVGVKFLDGELSIPKDYEEYFERVFNNR